MATYNTPGAFVEEISTLPASIAPVATAIPAFIGFTKTRILKGSTFAINIPKRITSLLEFEEVFGGAFNEAFRVTISDPIAGSVLPSITANDPTNTSNYILYYQVKMYFENGGGPCWVVSVGDMGTATTAIDKDVLKAGLKACEKEDEITLLCIPEAVKISASARLDLHDAMLAQCAKLQDRFAVMEVLDNATATTASANYRNNEVGANNLKYGASYYPSLRTTISYSYTDAEIVLTDNRTIGPEIYYNGKTLANVKDGSTMVAVAAQGTIQITGTTLEGHTLTINGILFKFSSTAGTNVVSTTGTATQIATALETLLATAGNIAITKVTAVRVGTTLTISASTAGSWGNSLVMEYSSNGETAAVQLNSDPAKKTTLNGGADIADPTLYGLITAELKKKVVSLYPAAAMCGVYATVDRNRGVWKAPANVGIAMVEKPNINISDAEQAGLNVDATSGKSINVIRKFAGKGTLVWGARTLAGNDNEWRYIPVRRLYIFIEESVKKATEFVVFEPNDANTWTKTKAMIDNFLTQLWRDGALAGAKPEDAFFVKIGLGITMTALDILEGRMNVEIGLAAVRPAEFIILKFSHLLAKS